MPQTDDFYKKRQEAVEELRQLSRMSEGYDIPVPPFVSPRNNASDRRKPHSPPPPPHRPPPPPDDKCPPREEGGILKDILSRFNLSFSDSDGGSDLSLLLALMLLLLDKDGDRLLLYALVYILL